MAQTLAGLWLIIGIAERAAVFIATSWMLILILLVASGNPSRLIDPYGALVKFLLDRVRDCGVGAGAPATNRTWLILVSHDQELNDRPFTFC